jgi:predicted PurR-regulated permease PerM
MGAVGGGSIRQLAQAGGLIVAAWLLITLADVLLMAFGAVLFAVLLEALSSPIERRLRLRRPIALTAAIAILATTVGALVFAFGSEASVQLAALSDNLAPALADLRVALSRSPLGETLLEAMNGWTPGEWLRERWPGLLADTTTALTGAVIVGFAGLYLAFHPQTYLTGALNLVPHAAREETARVLGSCHAALRQWLSGQLISMALVGGTVGAGLAAAGVPSPVALGIIAGLGQFVPVIGPMAATVPGLLIAFAAGPETLGWAVLVYLGASQLEANIISPLILRQMVQLPMAVSLFAVLAMGVLLGPLGVFFATPLAVVAFVVVKIVYVEGVLENAAAPPAPS